MKKLNNNISKEDASSLGKEARELEQRQYLQFQEKMLKKDAQMVELDQVGDVLEILVVYFLLKTLYFHCLNSLV